MLRVIDRPRTRRKDCLELSADRRLPIFRDFVNQTYSQGPVSIECLSRGKQGSCMTSTDFIDDERRNRRGNQTQPDFAKRELRFSRRNCHVCRRNQSTATPKCGALN